MGIDLPNAHQYSQTRPTPTEDPARRVRYRPKALRGPSRPNGDLVGYPAGKNRLAGYLWR